MRYAHFAIHFFDCNSSHGPQNKRNKFARSFITIRGWPGEINKKNDQGKSRS